jgi:hypothetical protein
MVHVWMNHHQFTDKESWRKGEEKGSIKNNLRMQDLSQWRRLLVKKIWAVAWEMMSSNCRRGEVVFEMPKSQPSECV